MKGLSICLLIVLIGTSACIQQKMQTQHHPLEDGYTEANNDISLILDTVYKIVEIRPLFPGYDTMDHLSDRYRCSDIAFLSYVQKNLNLTDEEKARYYTPISSTVQFVVRKDGYIDQIKIIKGDTTILGNRLISVIAAMNDMSKRWTPGYQKGNAVNVMMSVPIKMYPNE